MSTSILAGLVFVAVFGVVILVHEFGHFFVGRFFKVEIEEFGIGLPPMMFRFWREKGTFAVDGQKIEIPSNFRLPLRWQELDDRLVKITADRKDNKLVLRTIDTTLEEEKRLQAIPSEIQVNENGELLKQSEREVVQKNIVAGKTPGAVSIEGTISELYPGTDFTFNWLPFGGFNRFKGENNPEVEGGLAAASPGIRLAVLFAGAIMNLLTGVLVYTIIFSQIGIPNLDAVQVYEVTPGSPAAEAGFLAEDTILEINNEAINSLDEVRAVIGANLDTELSIILQRGDAIIETSATPLSSRSAEEGALGFVPSYGYQKSQSFFSTLTYGTQTTFLHAREILLMPARMLRGSLSPEEGRFIGFRGIYNIFQQTVDADVESRASEPTSSPETSSPPPTYYTLNLIATLTITLGVFNLLPFPALDGGRIFFIIPELLFKKRVPAQFENIVHGVGMMLLLGFMLYINVMDFVNPVDILVP